MLQSEIFILSLYESVILTENQLMENTMSESFLQEKPIGNKSMNGIEDMETDNDSFTDFSNAKNGKPLIDSPKDFNIPIYLEEDLREYFFTYAGKNKLSKTKYINSLLRKIMDKKEF